VGSDRAARCAVNCPWAQPGAYPARHEPGRALAPVVLGQIWRL